MLYKFHCKHLLMFRLSTFQVGSALAVLIDQLVTEHSLQLSKLIVIGHSLGAHIAGIAGQQVTAGKLPIIVGLDPAFPLFTRNNATNRLSADDAEYVQVIHTNGGRLSISYPVGDADFYVNWGNDQPGCSGTKSSMWTRYIMTPIYFVNLIIFPLRFLFARKSPQTVHRKPFQAVAIRKRPMRFV